MTVGQFRPLATPWQVTLSETFGFEIIGVNESSCLQPEDEPMFQAMRQAINRLLFSGEMLQVAWEGRTEDVRALLDRGVDVNTTSNKGYTARLPELEPRTYTALMWAAKRGRANTVRLLLERGADPNFADEDDCSCLMWGVNSGDIEAVLALLEGGAGVNLTDKHGYTALMWEAKKIELEVAEDDAGYSDEDEREDAKREPGAATGVPRPPTEDTLGMVRLLLEHNADIENRASDGMTALMVAAARGRVATVRALLDAGADIHARDRKSRTPLMWAAMMPDTESGFAVERFPPEEDRAEILRELLNRGADPNARDSHGKAAGDWAQERGRQTLVRVLRR